MLREGALLVAGATDDRAATVLVRRLLVHADRHRVAGSRAAGTCLPDRVSDVDRACMRGHVRPGRHRHAEATREVLFCALLPATAVLSNLRLGCRDGPCGLSPKTTSSPPGRGLSPQPGRPAYRAPRPHCGSRPVAVPLRLR
jgi:hypothetical protein